jgi:hypothetical protein
MVMPFPGRRQFIGYIASAVNIEDGGHVGNTPLTIESGQPPRDSGPDADRRDQPRDRSSHHFGLAANLITIVLGMVSLFQALRSNPLWILLGVVALGALVVYWFRRRRWTFTAIGLAVLVAFGSGGWLLAYTNGDKGQLGGAPPASSGSIHPRAAASTGPTEPTGGNPPDGTDAAAPLIFSDVVQLDKDTGVDLDGGRADKLYQQDAKADLYLAWGYILYSSARHSAMYNDSSEGSETGVYGRCQTYRRPDKESAAHEYIGGGSQQYCFTTSDGHPGWLQAINAVGDGGLILKVDVWQN